MGHGTDLAWGVAALALAAAGGAAGGSPPSRTGRPEQVERTGWKLVWCDEFDYEGLPDPAKWDYETGFVRNAELQYYTRERKENARVQGGVLVIEARKERFPNPGYDPSKPRSGTNCEFAEYTAASLITRGKASWTYGRFEVRAKLPKGRGTWPAIWMLGTNISEVGWPKCGEIDIMEYVGFDPDGVHTTVHTQAYNHTRGTGRGKRTTVERPYEDFHVYAMEWTKNSITFFVDEKRVFSVADDGGGVDAWPFTAPQYLLLNFAVGGSWGAAKGVDESIWPQQFLIDYVRVYERVSTPLREPDVRSSAGLKPGLSYKAYQGSWNELPDFNSLKPVSSGASQGFDIAAAGQKDAFGLVFEGLVEVRQDGAYVFYTESDDGSRLMIGDEVVADNDGCHAMRLAGGEVNLKAGLHRIRVEYFDKAGGEGLVVSWKGPGIPRQPIPATALFKRPGT